MAEVAICRLNFTTRRERNEFVSRFSISSNLTWQIIWCSWSRWKFMSFYCNVSSRFFPLKWVDETTFSLETIKKDCMKSLRAMKIAFLSSSPWLSTRSAVESVIRLTAKLWIWNTVWPSNEFLLNYEPFIERFLFPILKACEYISKYYCAAAMIRVDGISHGYRVNLFLRCGSKTDQDFSWKVDLALAWGFVSEFANRSNFATFDNLAVNPRSIKHAAKSNTKRDCISRPQLPYKSIIFSFETIAKQKKEYKKAIKHLHDQHNDCTITLRGLLLFSVSLNFLFIIGNLAIF